MSYPEHLSNQFRPFEAPAADTGGRTPDSSEPNRAPDDSPSGESPSSIDPADLMRLLRQGYTHPTIDLYMEVQLERVGLLPLLEEAGILPLDENPNPFSFETEAEAYDQWWEERPEERDRYDERLDERADALRLIHIGAILGHLLGDDLYRGRTFPNQEEQ